MVREDVRSEPTHFTALQQQGRAAHSGRPQEGLNRCPQSSGGVLLNDDVRVAAIGWWARVQASLNPAQGFFAGAKTGMPIPGARCRAWS